MTGLRLAEQDYHLHTVYSDGVLNPRELIEAIYEVGARRVAITDHETIQAYLYLSRQELPRDLSLHPGIELDCELGDYEVHLLGLEFDPDHERLREYLDFVQRERRKRYSELLERINKVLGDSFLTPENTFPTPDGTWMKPHVFRRLAQHPRFQNLEPRDQYRYFKEWLLAHGLTAPMPRLSLLTAIEMFREAGGIAVLAHPGYYWKHGMNLRQVLLELREWGLDGVEVLYPYFQPDAPEFPDEDSALETVLYIYRWSQELGLKVTRGSDVHLPEHIRERYPQLQRMLRAVAVSESPTDVEALDQTRL